MTATVDLTADYLEANRTHVLCLEEQAGAIAEVYSRDEADQMLARRRACVGAIEQGLLCRALFSAVPAQSQAADGWSSQEARRARPGW